MAPLLGPRPKMVGNQLLEVSGNGLNELALSKNRVVGQKINILAQLVWKIVMLPILDPFWSHLGNQLLEVSGNSLNELALSKNGVVGQKMNILAQLV